MVAMFPGSTLSQVWRANSPQLRELRTESGVSLFDALAENIRGAKVMVPSGKHTKSYWKWPFTVDFPIKNGDFP